MLYFYVCFFPEANRRNTPLFTPGKGCRIHCQRSSSPQKERLTSNTTTSQTQEQVSPARVQYDENYWLLQSFTFPPLQISFLYGSILEALQCSVREHEFWNPCPGPFTPLLSRLALGKLFNIAGLQFFAR